jgi:hypothetical protein
LITEFEVSSHWRPVAEVLWERDINANANMFSGLVGFIWGVAEGFDIDAGAVFATEGGEQIFEARLGLTWAVAVWEPKKVAAESEEHEEGGAPKREEEDEDEEASPHEEQQARK